MRRARRYAAARPGIVSFAILEGGRLRSSGGSVRFRSASLVKAMLLIADLRTHAASGRALSGADRARLSAMIRVSDNAAASATFAVVGRAVVVRLARAAGMRGSTIGATWGTSQLTAADQARFWGRLDVLLPVRYRAYGRRLLRSVVAVQTWGGARVARRQGFRTLLKAGWLPQAEGWLVHQGLHLERGRCEIGIAVLTGQQPSMATGTESIRVVVSRLLDGASQQRVSP